MTEPGILTAIPVSATSARRVERRFYVAVALAMLLFNGVAFAPSLLMSKRSVPLPLTPLVTAHAVTSVAWLLLFLLQARLVAKGRTDLHRRVGAVGSALAVAFVVLGSLTVIEEARRGFDLSGDLGRLPAPPGLVDVRARQLGVLFFFFEFAVLVGAAFWYRKRPAIHKRLMLIALLGALTPTPVAHLIGHWIGPEQWGNLFFPLSLAVALSVVLFYDRMTEGHIHPVSLWVSLMVFVSTVLFNVGIISSGAWGQFSAWLVR